MADIPDDSIIKAIFEVLLEAGCPVIHEQLHRRVESKFPGRRWPELNIDRALTLLLDSRRLAAKGVQKDVGWGMTIIESEYSIVSILDGLAAL
jgi:hypothetical protein